MGDDVKTGTLNNNLCPPAAQHSEKNVRGKKVEVTRLSPTDIDLRTTIIHVDDTHKAFVKAETDKNDTTNLSLAKYDRVRKGLGLVGPNGEDLPVPDNTQVYWLRLEDSALGTQPSSLVLGFSTGQFDEKYWNKPNGSAFQYELEAVRYYGPHTDDLPHVLAYWEPDLGSNLVWDSFDTDVNAMPLGAGEYEHLEWVFTHPGTYVLEVHLKGHVRQSKPADARSTTPIGTVGKRSPTRTPR